MGSLKMRLIGALALATRASSLDNGVGLTPAMGYNTWDDFRCGGINSTNVMKVADAIVRYGLDKVSLSLTPSHARTFTLSYSS